MPASCWRKPSEFNERLRRAVAERAYQVCEYCLVHEEDAYHGGEMDHILSLKHGGASSLDNLAFACFHCNRHKGTDIGARAETGAFVRLFNPRVHRWRDHFHLQSGPIEAATEVGAATAKLLEFNHPERVALRRILADTGRYPTIEALARMRE